MITVDEQDAMIDEQIERQKIRTNLAMLNADEVYAIEKAILASLERLKKIDAVKMPEEPEFIKRLIQTVADTHALSISCSVHLLKAIVEYIDTLRDLLKRESEKRSKALKDVAMYIRRMMDFEDRAEAAEENVSQLMAENAVLTNTLHIKFGNAIGEVRNGGVVWFNKNPHAFPEGTKFYAEEI